MANQQDLELLKQGIEAWNSRRRETPDLSEADLTGVDLRKADLRRVNLNEVDFTRAILAEADLTGASLFMATLVNADLSNANLSKANLTAATLTGATLTSAKLVEAKLTAAKLMAAELMAAELVGANLSRANLSKANLSEANLSKANLSRTNLSGANLSGANLKEADLSRADLSRAKLTGKANLTGANLFMTILSEADFTEAILKSAKLNNASLIRTNLKKANLTECSIYGISAWDVQLEGTIQSSLIITLPDEPTITVDNLEVAQFIYLLLNNQEIRNVIDTISKKVVLILGRFTDERKEILSALKNALREQDYLSVLFDFKSPTSRDLTETVTTLAHMARFVIADISDPLSTPQELAFIVPNLPSVPIQPVLQASTNEYGMFEHFKNFPWVLKIYRYKDANDLLSSLKVKVIDPAEKKAETLLKRRKRN